MINRDGELFQNYLESLKGRIFKILPLVEQQNAGVSKYLNSLLFELSGLENVIGKLHNNYNYIILIATLDEVYSEVLMGDYDLSVIRSEIMKSINVVEKLQKGG